MHRQNIQLRSASKTNKQNERGEKKGGKRIEIKQQNTFYKIMIVWLRLLTPKQDQSSRPLQECYKFCDTQNVIDGLITFI